MKDTIYALATILGKSGVAVIRVSGEQAKQCLDAFKIILPQERYAHYCKLYHLSGDVIDHGLVFFFQGPRSFTGEDVIEFHVHGGRAVIQACLNQLSSISGYRLAEPGEFSKRAFLNGKMDLTQAEGLADLIEAETDMQRKQAVRQMEGGLLHLYEDWRHQLMTIQMLVEAHIDFPEEEIPTDVLDRMRLQLADLCAVISRHLQDGSRGERVRRGLRIAILGAPNVGKSSLLNLLANQEVAIVSEIAGTTRDVLEVHLDLQGYAVSLVDTAGIRAKTDDVIEQEGIKRATKVAEDADILLIMCEATSPLESQLKPFERYLGSRPLILVNKVDLVSRGSTDVKDERVLRISTRTTEGIDRLLTTLAEEIQQRYQVSNEPIITRTRYRETLVSVLKMLMELNLENPIELVAEDLRYAASSLGRITGKIDVEDILGRIFSEFCIGK
ncbi:MAG: tRNA uridine-5-carboxymethylaminomethyl(34) synthesis GTPase MnmE [Alphaproteobacteria bacterium]|nr:tRNA uridine-5-carboxymethylaminomethyl(34) synthesis GTPase MnmE [Alphaproteobacteria bacterium]